MMNLSDYRIPEDKNIKLSDYLTSEGKKEDNNNIKENTIPPVVKTLKDLHLMLHAAEKNGIMVVLQAPDAAGKDEAISYIFSHLNAQGLKVPSYGQASETEQQRAYFWRLYAGGRER